MLQTIDKHLIIFKIEKQEVFPVFHNLNCKRRHLIYLIKSKRQYGGKVEILLHKHLYNNRSDPLDSNTILGCCCYTYNNYEFITMINSFSQKQLETEKNQKKSYRGF